MIVLRKSFRRVPLLAARQAVPSRQSDQIPLATDTIHTHCFCEAAAHSFMGTRRRFDVGGPFTVLPAEGGIRPDVYVGYGEPNHHPLFSPPTPAPFTGLLAVQSDRSPNRLKPYTENARERALRQREAATNQPHNPS